MKLTNALAAAFLTLTSLCGRVHAAPDDYPTKRVTIVVPFTAGGSTDAVARLLSVKLQAEMGQPFIVENRAGAGGNIGAEYVARANPDGYTLFMGTIASVANMSLYKNLSYDMARDLAPVSQAVSMPLVLIANNNLPIHNIRELVKYAKENPGKISYASGGSGSSPHLGGVMFEHLAGVKMLHVPYKGTTPGITDLMGGQIDIMFTAMIDGLTFVKSGKVKALGVTTSAANAQLPSVAPIATVVPGYNLSSWSGIFAPAATPAPVIAKLSLAIQKIMKQPDVRHFVEEQGSEPVGSTPQEFRKFLQAQSNTLRQLIEISGAKPD